MQNNVNNRAGYSHISHVQGFGSVVLTACRAYFLLAPQGTRPLQESRSKEALRCREHGARSGGLYEAVCTSRAYNPKQIQQSGAMRQKTREEGGQHIPAVAWDSVQQPVCRNCTLRGPLPCPFCTRSRWPEAGHYAKSSCHHVLTFASEGPVTSCGTSPRYW